jgi:hypothetical protein
MQFNKFLTGLAAAWGALLTAGVFVPSAMAGPVLPSYTVGGGCTAGPDFISPAPFCSQALAGGTDSLVYNLGPVPSLSASATAVDDPLTDFAYSAILSMSYSFEVVGGKPGDAVPLLIATDLTTSETGDGDGSAFISVTTSLTSESADFCSVDAASIPCASSSFSGTISAAAASGTVDTLILEVGAGAFLYNDGTTILPSSASASADPFIYVDPSFAGAANYQILVSPGIGNTPVATPEPGTLFLIFVLSPLLFLARWLRAAKIYF